MTSTTPADGGGWPPLDGLGGDAGDEWLLSDHPWATAERQRRRSDHFERELTEADEVLAITGRLAADPAASEPLARLAARLDPSARRSAMAAEIDSVVDDATFVAEARRRLENARQAGGDVDDRYPAHLTGAEAALVDPPTSTDRPDPA